MKPLVERLKQHVLSQKDEPRYPPVSAQQISEAEARLGFPIPETLKECYLHIGNGGFYLQALGLIGLEGGLTTDDDCSLVEFYERVRSDPEEEWPSGMLPFWEWGCAIWSCVDCNDPNHPIRRYEEGKFFRQSYTLDEFFELLIKGVDLFNYEGVVFEEVEINNPFTGKKSTIKKRKLIE